MSDYAPSDSQSIDDATNETAPDDAKKRQPLTFGQKVSIAILSLVLIVVATLINIPYQASNFDGKLYGLENEFFNAGHIPVAPNFTSAGWPTQYLLRVDYTNAPPLVLVSYSRFAFNAIVAFLAVVIVIWYRWHKSTFAGAIKSDTIKLSVSDMLVLMAICGGTLIYWQMMNQRSQNAHELANKIFQQQGTAHVAPVLPQFLKDRLPEFVLKMHERIIVAELNSPDNELIREVVAQPYLQKLSVTGTTFDAEQLAPIALNPRLWSLRISGRKLAKPDELQFVGSMPQLTALNLMRTSLTSSALNQWKGLSRIRFMHLVHTDLALSELSNPPWANEIQTLFLPRPPQGIGDSFDIDGWANLKELKLFEFEELVNDKIVTVSLSNLPSLEKFETEDCQKLDLIVNNTPRLESVGFGIGVASNRSLVPSRLGRMPYCPSDTWFRKLIVRNAPNVKTVRLFIGDLEECSLEGLHTDFKFIADSEVLQNEKSISSIREGIPFSKRIRAIKTLAGCEAIRHLTVRNLDGQGIEFDAFKQLPNLTTLSFESCSIDRDHLLQLTGCSVLSSLSTDSVQMDGVSLSSLLKGLPKLNQIKLRDSYSVNSLRLESHPLSRIDTEGGVFNLSALRLIDLPNFESVLGLKYPLKHLHISNVPKLRGLVVQGPLPVEAVLEITPAIEVLGLGGATISDEMRLSFSEMKKLRKLSLIDTRLSESKLLEIGEATSLKDLVVASDNFTESTAAQLVNLRELQRLEILTNSRISSDVLNGLGKLIELKYLTLRCSDPNASDFEWLSKLERLEMVRFEGWRCTPELLNGLKGLKNLACVAFENTEVSKEILETIGSSFGDSLIRLGLQKSTVDSEGLRFVMARRRAVSFELRDAKVDNRLITEAMKSNRLFTSYSDENHNFEASDNRGSLNRFLYQQANRRVDAEWDMQDPELINPSIFRLIQSTQKSN